MFSSDCNAVNHLYKQEGAVKPDLGLDQDQQGKINNKINWKADRTAQKGKFNAQYFG